MAKVKTIELSKEERNILAGVMRTKEIIQRDLAKLVKASQPTIARIMLGNSPPKADLAQKIYIALGKDPSLDFLINYSAAAPRSAAPRSQPESTGWDRIYEEGVQALKEIYNNQTPERKGAIIGELENLAGKYKGK